MTPKEIAELLDRISEWPWIANQEHSDTWGSWRVESCDAHGVTNDGWIISGCEGPEQKTNAAFIASAPLALAEMLVALVKERQLTHSLNNIIAKGEPLDLDESLPGTLEQLDIPPELYARIKKRAEGTK